MRKKTALTPKRDAPIFKLQAFGEKATWTDFYIQDLKGHINDHKFIETPHKHDFYLVMFIARGHGVHTIDFVSYDVLPGSLFLMTPGQVHSWTLSENINGFVIFFTKEFYQLKWNESNLLEFPFFHSLDASPVIQLIKDEVTLFVLNQMHREFNGSHQPNLSILRAYLEVFLLDAATYYRGNERTKTIGTTRKLRRLEQLIEQNFRKHHQPSYYGELMNLAPSYLNNICKDAIGKTLSDLIQQRILLEAKRIFAYSDLNVSEVAADLNFSDPSYFIRWFKKITGHTPEDFRRRLTVQP